MTPPPSDSFALAISRASGRNLSLQPSTSVWPFSITLFLPCLSESSLLSIVSPISPTSSAKKSMPLSTNTSPTARGATPSS